MVSEMVSDSITRAMNTLKWYRRNLKLRVGDKFDLWGKVMKEVESGRYAGPFESIPYNYYIQSPIGLVPKDKGTKTRLIFHLSYPKNSGRSVNENIPRHLCKVVYPDFEEAVKMCIDMGISAVIGKSDMSMAFRHMPMSILDFCYLILKAPHPNTGEIFYFVDKCLSFGSSIRCSHFQEISNGIAHVVRWRTRKPVLNYLDDYFFAATLKQSCDLQVNQFITVCREICFPVSLEKTFWGTTQLTFLGFLIDTIEQHVCIPLDKLVRGLELIDYFLSKKDKKVTVLQAQKLCGFLNFLCRCITPARAFTRRLYSMYTVNGVALKPHYHIKVKEEHRADLRIWEAFLKHQNIFCRPFIDYRDFTADDVLLYSDASGSFLKGLGLGARKAMFSSSGITTSWWKILQVLNTWSYML